MLLSTKGTITYGPVRSRRLGWSLGINALPPYRKTCTFDCLYCQYGRAAPVSPDTARPGFPPVDDVLAAIEEALAGDIPQPAYLTFSGNGEPTLHPQFGDLVDGVCALRNRLVPDAKVALLSNSSLAGNTEIASALSCLDVRIMKLDAGTDALLANFNRPWPSLGLEDITRGLRSLPSVTIQCLLAGGPEGNSSHDDIESLIACLQRIRPRMVQLYSLDRDAPTPTLACLDTARLHAIGRLMDRAEIPTMVF
ncbi:MAG: hypothetical protein MUE60_02130 [Candidatus Eisenbacteria bacterium]|nr:hypothetical protein [Candidatus Eisenbacteria bacterium]